MTGHAENFEGPGNYMEFEACGDPAEVADRLQERLTKSHFLGWICEGRSAIIRDGVSVVTMLFSKLSIAVNIWYAMTVTVAGRAGASTVCGMSNTFTLGDLEKAAEGLVRERGGE